MDKVSIRAVNSVHIQIKCDRGIASDIAEKFSFLIENAQFNPKVRARIWDGFITLYNRRNNTIYAGLREQVEEFLKSRDIEISHESDFSSNEFSLFEAKEFIASLDIPAKYVERDYQLETFVRCIRNKRHLFVSPTASGKTFMMYLIIRYLNLPTLIIVPRTNLVLQTMKDFVNYGYDPNNLHGIFSGQEKNVKKPIIVSTWQSIANMDKDWFTQFGCVIGDEAHRCKATNLTKILSACTEADYRYGFTGSLDEVKVNKMVLEGLFGPYQKIVSTKELADAGYVAKAHIKTLELEYDAASCALVHKMNYDEEMDWIANHSGRNKFIRNLALSLEGNVLILYNYIDKHLLPVDAMIREKAGDRTVYTISGKISAIRREELRQEILNSKSSIINASIGTFSEGIDIPNIHHVILAHPTKSKIWVLQIIGRGIRIDTDKDKLWFYDIVDNLIHKTKRKEHLNYTYDHYIQRLRYYHEEQHPIKSYKVAIK